MLTLIASLPLLGALVISIMKKENATAIKVAALVTSLLPALATIAMTLGFDKSATGFQYVERYA